MGNLFSRNKKSLPEEIPLVSIPNRPAAPLPAHFKPSDNDFDEYVDDNEEGFFNDLFPPFYYSDVICVTLGKVFLERSLFYIYFGNGAFLYRTLYPFDNVMFLKQLGLLILNNLQPFPDSSFEGRFKDIYDSVIESLKIILSLHAFSEFPCKSPSTLTNFFKTANQKTEAHIAKQELFFITNFLNLQQCISIFWEAFFLDNKLNTQKELLIRAIEKLTRLKLDSNKTFDFVDLFNELDEQIKMQISASCQLAPPLSRSSPH